MRLKKNTGLLPSGVSREAGDPLTVDCRHDQSEDCVVCRVCGRCSEWIDNDNVCSDCGGEDEPAQNS